MKNKTPAINNAYFIQVFSIKYKVIWKIII